MKKMIIMLSALSIISCAQKDSDKIADAQACLDNSTPATANLCLEKISGLSGQQAELIRCSAGFISEGLSDATVLAEAMSSLSESNNPTAGMMSILAFNSKSTAAANKTYAQETYDHCQAAGNPGFVLLSSFANMATVITSFGGLTGELTPAEMATAIASFVTGNDPASNEVLGATAVAAYGTSCTNGNSSNKDLCDQMAAAMAAGSTNEEIGAAIAAGWNAE